MGVDNIPNYKCLLSGTNMALIQFKVGYLRREAPMRKLFISVATLQFALSAATAQPATTSTDNLSVLLNKRGNVSKILANRTTKPLVHLEIVIKLEFVVVLPLVALQSITDPYLIAGATSESGITSVYAGGPTAKTGVSKSTYRRHDRCAPLHTVRNQARVTTVQMGSLPQFG